MIESKSKNGQNYTALSGKSPTTYAAALTVGILSNMFWGYSSIVLSAKILPSTVAKIDKLRSDIDGIIAEIEGAGL